MIYKGHNKMKLLKERLLSDQFFVIKKKLLQFFYAHDKHPCLKKELLAKENTY